MDHFQFKNGVLFSESVDSRTLARDFGTPVYVYSARTLLDHFQRTREAFVALNPRICFSVKSCQNLAILRLLREAGASFDVVSGGEMRRALEAGADPRSIVYAGVGKSDAEIRFALETGIGWFNVESEEELANIADLAARIGKTARVALRVNPDVDPHTHEYTATGKRSTKFGIDLELAADIFAAFKGRTGIDLCGIHVHIGSPVNQVQPYVEAVQRVLALTDRLRAAGHRINAINLGGGFGAHYDGNEAPPASDYAARIVPLLRTTGLEILLEPGRSISANAGILLTRVLYTKQAGDRRYIIVDAAMTELIRPALYGAFHFVWPVAPPENLVPPHRRGDLELPGCEPADVVGPVCESGDFLAKDRCLPPLKRGDLLAVFTTGAYGFVMGSQYNSRPRPPEVLVRGSAIELIRRRETYDDLVVAERLH